MVLIFSVWKRLKRLLPLVLLIGVGVIACLFTRTQECPEAPRDQVCPYPAPTCPYTAETAPKP